MYQMYQNLEKDLKATSKHRDLEKDLKVTSKYQNLEKDLKATSKYQNRFLTQCCQARTMIHHWYFLHTGFGQRYQKRTESDPEVLFEVSTHHPFQQSWHLFVSYPIFS